MPIGFEKHVDERAGDFVMFFVTVHQETLMESGDCVQSFDSAVLGALYEVMGMIHTLLLHCIFSYISSPF